MVGGCESPATWCPHVPTKGSQADVTFMDAVKQERHFKEGCALFLTWVDWPKEADPNLSFATEMVQAQKVSIRSETELGKWTLSSQGSHSLRMSTSTLLGMFIHLRKT